jgi:hypothetical protein
MFLGTISVQYDGFVPRPNEVTVRQWNTMKREAWSEAGEDLHARFLEKKFSREGAAEYGYTPRSGESGRTTKNFWTSYTGRKLRRYGHTRPLELTGELRSLVRLHRVEAVSTSDHSTVRIFLPAAQKANLQNPHSPIDMAGELRDVSERDLEQACAVVDRKLDQLLRSGGESETVTI